ncbi:hypothetical protein [Primorskyibacter flagellatus]|uniref:hypothetical protein n=1 Tax=Primorskyibacter flagellatus TaxID=1387277 RepID=UPI001179BF7D|nr:hypothetical protein [Primorskyibacter flagellatus]
MEDKSPKPKHVWNRIPDEVRRKVVKLALKEKGLSLRATVPFFQSLVASGSLHPKNPGLLR